jgi:phenylacetate-CoA ligase
MHLSPSLRQRAERALGAPVIDYYSSAETGPIAWECRQHAGRFHVLLPDVWVEAVDGELVVTRLRDSVLPLLRYRMGDAGEVGEEDCRCGYRGPTIHGLVGRRSCSFLTPEGGEVDAWQLAWAFQHHPLDGFRLSQQTRSGFRLELPHDISEASVEGLLPRLRRSLQALGWTEPRIEWRRVPAGTLAAAKPEPFMRRFRLRGSHTSTPDTDQGKDDR